MTRRNDTELHLKIHRRQNGMLLLEDNEENVRSV